MKRSWWPLLLFGGLLVMLAAGLGLRPSEVPSPLIGKPAPSFRLPLIGTPEQTLSPQDLRGQVWLLNVWASWCVACRQEHEVVLAASQSGAVPIYGLNYKDQRSNASQWLARFGDPYVASLSDTDGRVGIDFGVYGVPETFLIDKQGIVRHKLTGPLTPEAWRDTLLPLIRKLNG